MANYVNVSKLGGNQHDLNRTSVVFLKDKAPMHIAFNRYVMEGEHDDLQVIKDNGNYRPFLVIDHPELHAKVAIYLTSNITEERMKVDNEVRGEHLFRTPYALMNYISTSSVSGKVDEGRLSVIDRDRFFFITDDWIETRESRAKDYEEFNIGLSMHAKNLQEIDETLTKDLAKKNYVQSLTECPTTELWAYKMGEQRPVNYHPTAQYLMLALNAFVQYKNPKHALSGESLKRMGELASNVAYVYGEYISFIDDLYNLEVKNPKLYKAFVQTRYWNNTIAPTMQTNIRNHVKQFGFFKKNNGYKNIYGNPKHPVGAGLDDIISQEFSNVGIRETKVESEMSVSSRSIIKNLLAREKSLYDMLENATGEVIEFLGDTNEEERINLSEFSYAYKFWESFIDNVNDVAYIEQLTKDFEVKYMTLQRKKSEYDAKKREKRQSENKARKEAENAEKERLKERAQKIKSLEKRIENNYIEQYLRAYRLYEQGKLLPIPVEEMQEVARFSSGGLPNYENLTIGSSLATKFRQDLMGMTRVSEQLSALLNIATIAEKKLAGMDKLSKNEERLLSLMDRISAVEEKVTKKNKKVTPKERKIILKEQIHEMLTELPEEELDGYLSDEFELGKSSEDILKNMQDIFHARTTIRSYVNMRNNKLEILNALETINDDKLIQDFKLSQEAMSELKSKGLVLPMDLTTLSLEEINSSLKNMASVLNKKVATKDDYKVIQDALQGTTAKMRRFTAFSQKLIDARTRYLQKLTKYESETQGVLEDTFVEIDKKVAEFEQNVTASLSNPEHAGFKKHEDGGWVAVNNEERKLTDEDMEYALKKYWESTEECRHHENYVNVDADKEVIRQIYDKLFPSAEQMLIATRNEVASSKNIDDAISRYKSAEMLLDELIAEKDKFKLFASGEYDYILYSAEDLLEIAINWGFMMHDLGDGIVRQLDNFDYPSGARNAIIDAVNNVCYQEKETIKNEVEAFKEKYRKRVKEVVQCYQPRTQVFRPIEQYMSRSSVKSTTIDGQVMPKSVLGENGITEKFQEYSYSKQRQCEIFCAIIAREEHLYKPAEVSLVRKRTHSKVLNAIESGLYRAQEEEMTREILTIKEALRMFALKRESNQAYLNNPQGFEADMQKLKKTDKTLSRIYCSFKRPGAKAELVGVDYFNFFDEVLKMLPEVKATLEDKNPYTKLLYGKTIQGEVDEEWSRVFEDIMHHFEFLRAKSASGQSKSQEDEVKERAQIMSSLKNLHMIVNQSGREKELMEMMPNLAKIFKEMDEEDEGGDEK